MNDTIQDTLLTILLNIIEGSYADSTDLPVEWLKKLKGFLYDPDSIVKNILDKAIQGKAGEEDLEKLMELAEINNLA
jgi:hypothetical protein